MYHVSNFVSAEASLSLTDVSEIPDDAELAETFYSQFEDEFENDESEDEMDDEDDLSALMGQMQDALDQTTSRDETLAEADLPSEGLTDTWRYQRIQALQAYPFTPSKLNLCTQRILDFERIVSLWDRDFAFSTESVSANNTSFSGAIAVEVGRFDNCVCSWH